MGIARLLATAHESERTVRAQLAEPFGVVESWPTARMLSSLDHPRTQDVAGLTQGFSTRSCTKYIKTRFRYSSTHPQKQHDEPRTLKPKLRSSIIDAASQRALYRESLRGHAAIDLFIASSRDERSAAICVSVGC